MGGEATYNLWAVIVRRESIDRVIALLHLLVMMVGMMRMVMVVMMMAVMMVAIVVAMMMMGMVNFLVVVFPVFATDREKCGGGNIACQKRSDS